MKLIDTTRLYFPALTGLRALMAWDVFLFHFGEAPADSLRGNFFNGGGDMGVLLFFVLSGFLIAYKYLGIDFSKSGEKRNYFLHRFARVYPVFFIISLASVLYSRYAGNSGIAYPPMALLLHFTLLKAFFENQIFLVLAPSWSLSAELFFYLLAPVIFTLLPRVRLLVQCAAVFVAGMGIAWLAAGLGATDFMHTQSFTLGLAPFGRIFQFGVGIGLAMLLRRRPLKPMHPLLTLISGSLLLCVQAFSFWLHHFTWFGFPAMPAVLFNDFITPFFIILFFYAVITGKSLFRRMLEHPAMQLFGASSYAFYLLHLASFLKIPRQALHIPVIIYFMIVQVFAILVYLFLEKPINKWIVRSFRNRDRVLYAGNNTV